MNDEVLTVQQVAELLKVSRSTIQNRVVARQIPHFRLGRRVLFMRDALNKWMSEGGAR